MPKTSSVLFLGLALALFVTLPVYAAPPPTKKLSIPPSRIGERTSFNFTFEGHFGAKNDEMFADVVSIMLDRNNSATVSAEKLQPLTIGTKRAPDGSLTVSKDPSQLNDVIIDYNSLVGMVVQAPHPLVGSWTATIPVRVSPDTWNDVPVNVHFIQGQKGGLTIEAAGTLESTLFFKGFTFPIDITVHSKEMFSADGHLGSAMLAVEELTQGGLGPKLSYNWRFDARKPA
jgi:hypothetical protein